MRLAMMPQTLSANRQVVDDAGRVAVQRGPLVYCLEQLDQPSGVDLTDASVAVSMKPGAEFTTEFKKDFLGGIVVLHRDGAVAGDAARLAELSRWSRRALRALSGSG